MDMATAPQPNMEQQQDSLLNEALMEAFKKRQR
jgi:hypothetical protein